ncbi:MAG: MBL fold metallo-hydrolase [Planctomycetota bacterium]|nr:MBL fold metallo-hydrolase [Planctomycetota bacterium]
MSTPDQAPETRAPRPSAAILLCRRDGAELEVYLAERSPKLRFFGGSWAFPGGVLDTLDEELAAGLPSGPSGVPSAESEGPFDDQSLTLSALRELFEETGVLLEPLASALPRDTEAGRAARAELRAGLSPRRGATPEARRAWQALCAPLLERGATPAARLTAALRPIGRITTPGFRPRRYETLFLLAELPAGEVPEVIPGELVAGRFVKPAEALAAWRRGEERIVPPALFLLEFLAQAWTDAAPDATDAAKLDAALEAAGVAMAAIVAGRLHSAYTSPGVLAAPLRTPTLPPAATTNTYLVGHSDLYVIDPGTSEDGARARLYDTLDRGREPGREVRGVLLTHRHGDHIGSVSALCERYAVPLFAHQETLDDLAPLWGEVGLEASISAGGGHRLLGSAPAEQVAIGEGHAFELGTAPDGSPGWQLVAHHTPGHAKGHLVFRDSRYGTMIVGDMVSTMSTIVIDPPEGHLATYLKSLRRLIELGEQFGTTADGEWNLLPAHGPWTHKGRTAVERYLEHRGLREESLVRALGTGLRTPRELVAHVYADTAEEVWPIAERSLAAGLEKLREEGRLPD